MNMSRQTDIQELILEYNSSRIIFAEEEEEEARLVVSLKDVTERKRAEQALAIKTEQLATVTEAMATFVGSGDFRNASALLLGGALRQTESEYGFVGVVGEGPVLRVLAHEGIVWNATLNREFYENAQRTYREAGYLEFTKFNNLFGRVITSGKPVLSNEPSADPRSGGLPPGHPALRHFLGVPILTGSEVVGMIGIANRPGGYTGQEQAKIEILSRAASVLYDSYRRREREIALEKRRQQEGEELQRRAHEFAALYETSCDLATRQDVPSLLQIIVERAMALLDAPVGGIYLYDPLRRELELMCVKGAAAPVGTRLALGEGLAGRVAQTLRPMIVEDYQTWEHRSPKFEGMPIPAIMVVPMLSAGELLGVVSVNERERATRKFSGADARLLSMFASQAASAVHKARLFEEARARAEQLAASENRLRTILESVPECVKLVDAHGTILDMNPAGLAMVEADRLEQVVGNSVDKLVTPEDHTVLRSLNEAVFRGESRTAEFEIVGLKGTHRRMESHACPLRDLEGKVFAQLAVGRDITERKRAEKRLAAFATLGRQLNPASEATTAARIIVKIADDLFGWGACTLDLYDEKGGTCHPVLNIDTVNGQRQDIPPAYVDEQPTPRMREAIEKGGRLILRDEPIAMTPDLIPFGDTNRPSASIMIVPIRHGAKVIGVLSLQSYQPKAYSREDLEALQALADHCGGALERIRGWEALQQSEARIREQAALLDQARDAIFVRDLEERITYWNKGAEGIYGWSSEEVVGRRVSDLLYKNPPPHSDEIWKEVLETGEWSRELNQITQSGKEIAVLSRRTLLRDDNGEPRAVLNINSDITEKRQLESQLLRKQRIESLGRLSSGIAHDLNNILSPILMAVHLARLKAIDAETDRLLTIIGNNAQRGADIVRQILLFARGAQGAHVQIQPSRLIVEMARMARETFLKSIRVSHNVPSDLWTVHGDPTQLDQVLMNLCVNARDAMPDGGTLTLTAENSLVDETFASMGAEAKPGKYLLLQVRDTGSGISPEVLEHIFDPFFSTKEQGKGTGLGLATVLGIVKGHGGFVRVQSELGKGSVFKVYLPEQSESPAATAAATEEIPSLPRGQGQLILVVDDEADIQNITQTILVNHGYQVVLAEDGVRAVAEFARHSGNIKLVITDIMMPSMDGVALVRVLKKMDPHIKVVVSSGLSSELGQEKRIEDLKASGVNIFLAKPYNAPCLLSRVAEVLQGHTV